MKRQATPRASDGPARPAGHGRPRNEVQVIPDERTTWRVYETDADAPITEYSDATDADLAARALGARR